MKTCLEVACEVIVCAVLVIGMVTIFMGAVLQESYKNYPPTAEEIAENPELVRYEKWGYLENHLRAETKHSKKEF